MPTSSPRPISRSGTPRAQATQRTDFSVAPVTIGIALVFVGVAVAHLVARMTHPMFLWPRMLWWFRPQADSWRELAPETIKGLKDGK